MSRDFVYLCGMAWAKVQNPKEKPLKWWWHKFWCELAYSCNRTRMYYAQLSKLCAMGWNLYGERYGNAIKK